MESKQNTISDAEEYFESEDSLSLCNFSIENDKETSAIHSPTSSSTAAEEFFEFFSKSSPRSAENNDDEEEEDVSVSKMHRSNSFGRSRLSSQSEKNSFNYQIQKVNLTLLTSMSAKSRKCMFMLPVKFKPEMELSAIKERQGRRVPTAMFPESVADDGGERTLVSGAAGGENGNRPRRKSGNWAIIRSLRGRSYLTTVLGRTFGCMSSAGLEKCLS